MDQVPARDRAVRVTVSPVAGEGTIDGAGAGAGEAPSGSEKTATNAAAGKIVSRVLLVLGLLLMLYVVIVVSRALS